AGKTLVHDLRSRNANRNPREFQNRGGHRKAMIMVGIEFDRRSHRLVTSTDAHAIRQFGDRSSCRAQQLRDTGDAIRFFVHELWSAVEFTLALGERAKRRE